MKKSEAEVERMNSDEKYRNKKMKVHLGLPKTILFCE